MDRLFIVLLILVVAIVIFAIEAFRTKSLVAAGLAVLTLALFLERFPTRG